MKEEIMDKCIHSLTEGTCWLCKGGDQEQPRSGGGSPSWFVNLTQLAIRRQWGNRQNKRLGFGEQERLEQRPKGAHNENSKEYLPYMKSSKDTKTLRRYSESIRKK